MEPLFINKLSHTKKIYIEMNKRYSGLSRTLISLLLFAVYFSLGLFMYFYFYEIISAVILIAISIALLCYPTARFYIIARKREKQFLELYDGVPECETYFFDDGIKSVSATQNSSDELNLSYEKIINVKQSKNLYLLILSKKIVVIVDKNRFEKGTCEEFEKFIKEKAVNAKIRL